ncbi:MAG: restriction endonuclease subunit R, partial [Firmicutes bacterium]|nr:restriction endonuclease subunit R [Bacillota bacterium]
ILQYRHYLNRSGRARELNRVILLTPNEGLSLQHLEEFKLSGLPARIFKKENTSKIARVFVSSLFPEETSGREEIEIIDINKLRDEMGEKTVAVDAFEGNNLVLVDEGHRGSSGEEWKAKRDKLCAGGFSFEYSATFGQAMKKSSLVQEYARCILFDYSYKYFYRDGYGKEYKILNLADDRDEDKRRLFLTACLLAFYQQLKLFADKREEFAPFLLEKPLLVFVGGSVNAVRTENRRKVSDVVDILLFINDFIKEEEKSLSFIQRLLGGRPQLLDENGKEVFAGAFTYLHSLDLNGEQVYRDILNAVFNCPVPGAVLHVERFKNGEIGLRVGNNDYFGVINVGDDAELLKLCAANGLSTATKEISDSLFQQLNDRHSLVNVLIGSKKFSEGWNSWRVSTMGLMNIGRTEGSEIIQLFGRGVRLKGYGYSLKRSSALFGDDAPEYLEKVETLNIFGIRADYMRQFKEYLEEEGLPKDDDWLPFVLPVVKLPVDRRLKVIKIRDDADFKKKGPRPVLDLPDDRLLKYPVVVDWYPRVQALQSGGRRGVAVEAAATLETGRLTCEHLALLDLDAIYFELVRFKNGRNLHNLNITRSVIEDLLRRNDWYILYIPREELAFDFLEKARRWQEIAVALLKKYCERYYHFKQEEYESDKMEYISLAQYEERQAASNKKGNIIDEYRFRLQKSEVDLAVELGKLKEAIVGGELKDFSFGHLEAICFNRHLYQPLVYFEGNTVKVYPVALNKGERDFVVALRDYYNNNQDFFAGRVLYLLRNQGRGRGIGFFEANNFYPDFILWLLTDDRQYITFVDPKGLRNCDGTEDPKLKFYETVKNIERRLGDPGVVLHSFIISRTPLRQIRWWRDGLTEEYFEERHVFFPPEGSSEYIGKMLARVLYVIK